MKRLWCFLFHPHIRIAVIPGFAAPKLCEKCDVTTIAELLKLVKRGI